MINLLPPEEKQRLIDGKKEKLAMVWGIMVLVSLVCLSLLFLSIEFYILADTNYQKISLAEAEKENKTPDFISTNDTVQKYNGILANLNNFYEKEIYFNQALKIISEIPVPGGLYMENFSLVRGENNIVQVSVSGVSNTRDNLLTFKKNIESDSNIQNSYFSPSSWIDPKNVKFSLTLEIHDNEK